MSEVHNLPKPTGTEPETLLEAVVYFQNPDNCIYYLAVHRWRGGEPVCPTCGSKDVGFIGSRRMFQCRTRHPKAQFSIKVGTIFEDSPLGLDKWLPAMWLVASNRNGISSWELHRALKVTQKTAWFMLHRIRLAMQDDLTGGNLGGEVEVDETFIGGKARNMHKDRKARVQKAGRNTGGKAIVLGMLERGGKVRASVIVDRTKASIQPIVRGSVEPGTEIHSDEHGDNWKMDEYHHLVVNHLAQYVDGNVHTNGIENFWSLLKRTINGTYVSVEPFHLFRYVDEQAFRFNNRLPMSDKDRFSYLLRKIVGKRLTFDELTGKEVKKQGDDEVSAEEPF
jgi:transposase-like protein